jgi:predicted nucleotidyltransferase
VIRYIRDKEIEKKIIDYLADKGAKKIEIFGSYARGEDYNDIDVIVEFEKVRGMEFFSYGSELKQLINKNVDVLTLNSISEKILPYIKKDKKVIYEKT